MRCPNCGYTHGYEFKSDGVYSMVDGGLGGFYKTEYEICLKRDIPFGGNGIEEKNVYGCPECKFVFID